MHYDLQNKRIIDVSKLFRSMLRLVDASRPIFSSLYFVFRLSFHMSRPSCGALPIERSTMKQKRKQQIQLHPCACTFGFYCLAANNSYVCRCLLFVGTQFILSSSFRRHPATARANERSGTRAESNATMTFYTDTILHSNEYGYTNISIVSVMFVTVYVETIGSSLQRNTKWLERLSVNNTCRNLFTIDIWELHECLHYIVIYESMTRKQHAHYSKHDEYGFESNG